MVLLLGCTAQSLKHYTCWTVSERKFCGSTAGCKSAKSYKCDGLLKVLFLNWEIPKSYGDVPRNTGSILCNDYPAFSLVKVHWLSCFHRVLIYRPSTNLPTKTIKLLPINVRRCPPAIKKKNTHRILC